MIKTRYLLFIQLIAWTGFMLVDLLEELYSIDFLMEVFLFLPFMIAVLYFIKRKSIWTQEQQQQSIWKIILQFVITAIKWLVVTAIITTIITMLLYYNKWIIPQDSEPLNGLEYTIYGIALCKIPIDLILIGEFLIWIFKKCRAYLQR